MYSHFNYASISVSISFYKYFRFHISYRIFGIHTVENLNWLLIEHVNSGFTVYSGQLSVFPFHVIFSYLSDYRLRVM